MKERQKRNRKPRFDAKTCEALLCLIEFRASIINAAIDQPDSRRRCRLAINAIRYLERLTAWYEKRPTTKQERKQRGIDEA